MKTHTDKELLELAAKAAAYEIEWKETITSRIAEFGAIKHQRNNGFWLGAKKWNPLDDDGDALRLAVKLRMDVGTKGRKEFEGAYACVPDEPKFKYVADKFEQFGNDPHAATRRAIVRAAAEIGANL